MREMILKAVAAVAVKSAEKAGNCASIMGFHQPKEPKDIQSRLDAMKKRQ